MIKRITKEEWENAPKMGEIEQKKILENLNKEMAEQIRFLQSASLIVDNTQMQALYEGVIGLYKDVYDNLSISPDLIYLLKERDNILQALINDQEKLKNNVTKIATRRIENYYYTTNTRVEYLWFYSDDNEKIGEFILQNEKDKLTTVLKKKKANDNSVLCEIGLINKNPDDLDFIIKNRVLCGSILSALHGVVYDECKNFYKTNKDYDFSLLDNKPIITLDSIYRAFTRNNDVRFSDVKGENQALFIRALEIFRHCDIILNLPDTKTSTMLKGTFYLFPADIIEATNYNKSIQTVFRLNAIPPILLLALHSDKGIKKVLVHSPSKAKLDGERIFPSFKNITDYSLYNPIHNFILTEKNKRLSYSTIKYSTLFSRYLPYREEEVLSRKIKRITNILDTLKEEKIIYKYESNPSKDTLKIFYYSDEDMKKIEDKKEEQKNIKDKAKAERLGKKEADLEFKKKH